jgi:methionyl-tRNA formyltransferase
MKVVFFGSSRYIIPILDMLKNFSDLTLIVTTEQGSMEAIPFYAKTKKVEYISVRKTSDLITNYDIQGKRADLGIVADFGIIIPEETMRYFTHGIINVHPSLLPKYRGSSPVQNAILNGDLKTGVTIIKLDSHMDHGPILSQIEEEILPSDTSKSLYDRLFKLSTDLLKKTIQDLETGHATLTPQDHDAATFTKELKRDDGFIDFKTISSKEFFDRIVRAYYPWPGVWTKAKLNPDASEKIIKFMPSKKLQVEGGREMEYKDFINGYPNAEKIMIDFLKKDI